MHIFLMFIFIYCIYIKIQIKIDILTLTSQMMGSVTSWTAVMRRAQLSIRPIVTSTNIQYLLQVGNILHYTANEGQVRIQYKCLVPIYVLPKMKLWIPKKIIMFCLPVPTFIYLWEIYIFLGSVCLFCCMKICGPILGIYKSLADTWMWKLGLRPRNSQKKNT